MDENGECKFLKDWLCSIQLEYGYKYLSIICLTYPRQEIIKVGENLETCLSMACPNAVRTGLYSKEPMTFKYIQLERTHGKSLASLPPRVLNDSIGPLIPYVVEIRKSCINIMQTRSLPIADRIFVIGVMLNKLREISDTGDYNSTPPAAIKYVEFAKEGQFDGLLSSFSDNDEVRKKIKTILYRLLADKHVFIFFHSYFDKIASKMKKEKDELTLYDIYSSIDISAEKHWQNILCEYGHILENYFVNYIFSSIFPFAAKLGIQHHILILAQTYALFKIIFCAGVDETGKIPEEYLIKAINVMYQHTRHGLLINKLAENYIISGMDSLPYVSFLLRD